MARRRISIDDKIEQQKLVVSKAKDKYEAELEQLNQLIKIAMSYTTRNCFRQSSIATDHLRRSWIFSPPMTFRNNPGSRRELIFQEVHNLLLVRIPTEPEVTLHQQRIVYNEYVHSQSNPED